MNETPDLAANLKASLRSVITRREAVQRLISYDAWASNRDNIIREAYGAGVSKHEIFRRTGIARTTIDRILGADNEYSVKLDQDSE